MIRGNWKSRGPPQPPCPRAPPFIAAGLQRRRRCATSPSNSVPGEPRPYPLYLVHELTSPVAHNGTQATARRRSSTAAPRRTPLRYALGHIGHSLGRVTSCACSQALFLPKPSTGTAQTAPTGELRRPEPPWSPNLVLRTSPEPNNPLGSLPVPLAFSQAKLHLFLSPERRISFPPAVRRRGAGLRRVPPPPHSPLLISGRPIHHGRPRLDRRIPSS